MNMDETGVPLFFGDDIGNVPVARRGKRSTQPLAKEPTQRATRHQLRGQATHAALICDHPEIKKLVPQVVVGDRHLLPTRVQRELAEALPENISLLRLPSRWMDAPLTQAIVQAIARVIRGFPDLKPVLLLDCCPALDCCLRRQPPRQQSRMPRHPLRRRSPLAAVEQRPQLGRARRAVAGRVLNLPKE